MHADVLDQLRHPLAQELLLRARTLARLAYIGLDGDPRVVPVAFLWDGAQIVVGTVPTSAKVRALQDRPRVAITIDTQWPLRALFLRGTATLEEVVGVPDAYIEASRKTVPADEFPGWEAGVRRLYDEMTLIRVVPDWVKLLDFETTIPKAVEDLARAKFG